MLRTLSLVLAALFVGQSAANPNPDVRAVTTITTSSDGTTTTITSSFSGLITSTGAAGQPVMTIATEVPLTTIIPFTTTVTPTAGPASGSAIPLSANFTTVFQLPFLGVLTFGNGSAPTTTRGG